MLKHAIRTTVVAVAATAALTTLGATAASAAPATTTRAAAQPAAVAPALATPGPWRLYSILSTPQECWYVGAMGVWNNLWYDFTCIGVNLTPIGPGVDYLWVR